MKGGTRTTNPGDVPVAVVFAENCASSDDPLLHVTVRRTVQAEQKLMFEIDHYDLHFVHRQEALHDPGVWKANFVGGGRIPHLVRRLNRMGSLGSFLDEAIKNRQWRKGEGYIAGSEEKIARLKALQQKRHLEGISDGESKELKALEKRHRPAPWLTGHDMLPTAAFTSSGVDFGKVQRIKEELFTEPRNESLFSGPLLLIKEVIEAETERIPVVLLDEGICFLDRILGIHAPQSQLADLKRVRDITANHRLVRFHILATSPEYLVGKSSACREADILRLPFPESGKDLELSPLEDALIDDALNHVADFKRKGNQAAIQNPPSDEELVEFGNFFCRVLGSVYQSLRAAPPVRLSGGICCPFYFGTAPSEHFEQGIKGELKLDSLLTTVVGSSLRCRRVLRVFRGNMLFLVKPPQLRYWLRSIAVRDADEIFVELQGQGH